MHKVIRIIAALVIWIVGCAIADFVFEIETNTYAMAWGLIVGLTMKEVLPTPDHSKP